MNRSTLNLSRLHAFLPIAVAIVVVGCSRDTPNLPGIGSLNVPPLSAQPVDGGCIFDWSHARVTYFAPNDPGSDGNSDAANLALSYNVWMMNADGSNKTALTKNTVANVNVFFPTFSPDGRAIFFNSTLGFSGAVNSAPESAYNIWAVNTATGQLLPITQNTNGNHSDGSVYFSPDSNKIFFSSTLNLSASPNGLRNPTHNIWSLDALDGVPQLRNLTAATQVSCESNGFEYSPDGTKILFASRMALDADPATPCLSVFNVWVMNVDGSGKIALTRNTDVRSQPAGFSTEGDKILFYSRQAVNGVASDSDNIWIMNLDGTEQTPLTTETQANFDSRVWRNGMNPLRDSTVVFQSRMATSAGHSGAAQPYNLWIMNLDGSNPRAITTSTDINSAISLPRYSPDATKIIYLSSEAPAGVTPWTPTPNVWIRDANGSNARALTTNSNGNMVRIGTNDVVDLPKICN